jgi:hypothetical protein
VIAAGGGDLVGAEEEEEGGGEGEGTTAPSAASAREAHPPLPLVRTPVAAAPLRLHRAARD